MALQTFKRLLAYFNMSKYCREGGRKLLSKSKGSHITVGFVVNRYHLSRRVRRGDRGSIVILANLGEQEKGIGNGGGESQVSCVLN